jgi:hypothetical protein
VDKSNRVAIAVLATGVLLGAAIVAISATEFSSSGQMGCLPCGAPPLALGGSVDAAAGSGSALENWYNFSVYEASPSITLGGLTFELKAPTGSNMTPPPGSGVDVLAPNDALEANYLLGGKGTYEPGYAASTRLTSGSLVSLFYVGRNPSSLSGDWLFVSASLATCSTEIT